MATVRARDNYIVSLYDSDGNGFRVNIEKDAPYDDKSELVKGYPWAFMSDIEWDTGAIVEQATAAPGERRRTRRT